MCRNAIKKVTYDLACDSRLIISFGTVVKIIFTRCDYLISLGTYFTHTHIQLCAWIYSREYVCGSVQGTGDS